MLVMFSEAPVDSYEYGAPSKPNIDRSILPTAPRAARGPDVDMNKIPSKPPYTAFLGNLPYDISEEDIEGFFRGLEVISYCVHCCKILLYPIKSL